MLVALSAGCNRSIPAPEPESEPVVIQPFLPVSPDRTVHDTEQRSHSPVEAVPDPIDEPALEPALTVEAVVLEHPIEDGSSPAEPLVQAVPEPDPAGADDLPEGTEDNHPVEVPATEPKTQSVVAVLPATAVEPAQTVTAARPALETLEPPAPTVQESTSAPGLPEPGPLVAVANEAQESAVALHAPATTSVESPRRDLVLSLPAAPEKLSLTIESVQPSMPVVPAPPAPVAEPPASIPAQASRDIQQSLVVGQEPDDEDIWDALRNGSVAILGRYRYEQVDDDAFAADAYASTLRIQLTYQTQAFHDFRGLFETESVVPIGNDLYNSTTNGETGRPTVADPKGTEINQAYLSYEGIESVDARLGRQRINLDNQRFIGSVAWRQNEQTFDALSAHYEEGDARVFYSFAQNANRIFGEDSPVGDARMDGHIVNASYGFGLGRIVGYLYYLDVDNLTPLATSTAGSRFTGKQAFDDEWTLAYTGEYAAQHDIGDNPNSVDADYVHGELGLGYTDLKVSVGYELLSGDGTAGGAFQTPFATLHKFNGWADKFLTTPDNGLEDLYVSIGGKLLGGKWLARYHDFTADTGGADYGTEFNLLYTRKMTDEVSIGLKYADYSADTFSTDAQRFWFWINLVP